MISKIKSILLGALLVVSLSLPISVPVIANAADTSAICSGVNESIGNVTSGAQGTTCAGASTANGSIDNTISLFLNLFSAIVGIIAVVMIIVGGVKYITSGGSSEKTTSAKDTILFAIVGLIVVALAQIIVKFVLNKAAGL
jgi:hypothetical protein